MRIIGGQHKGIILHPPKGLPVRPTTDRAKESLFNILGNHFDFDTLHALDLFSGTGNIALELASRGAGPVTAVDLDAKCVAFIRSCKEKLGYKQMQVLKSDAFSFLNKSSTPYDLIFADAPYAMKRIIEIPVIVRQRQLLSDKGWLVVEHEANLDLSHESSFFDKRVYGQSAFSFFSSNPNP